MFIRSLIAVGLVLVLAAPGLAARSDLEKDLKRYEKIVKKTFCICRAAGLVGRIGFLQFFETSGRVEVNCRIRTYDGAGARMGHHLCGNDEFDIVGQ